MNGRTLLKYALTLPAIAVGATLVAGTFATPGAQAQETIVFAGWGGSWQAAERTHFFESFEKATGIKVIDVPGVNLAKIKAMVGAKNVEWDVVHAIGMWVPDRADGEDLWEALDYNKIDTDGVPKELLRKNGVPIATFAQILAYNTKAFPEGKQPKSWADFFDTKKFPGKRGFLNQPRYAIDAALMAAGEPKEKLYPLNVDAALKTWDPIKKDVLWWEQWPQSPSLLASGELAMSLSSQARIIGLKQSEKTAPVDFTWNQGIMTVDYLAVPKGTKHKEAAFKLVSWMLDAKRQAEYAKATTVGPSNSKSLALLDDATKEQLPSFHYLKGELLRFDDEWWSKELGPLTERWNKWKLQ
jgi:putative spermidine/putrescine transport system substrate-binding protein